MCRGKVHEAQAAWQLSLRWAERINLPVDSALARLELARSAPEDTLERQNHVQLALACFRESKVPRLIEEAESLA